MGKDLLLVARERLADLWSQPYHKAAILSGQWDDGRLMKNMIAKVEAEAMSAMEVDKDE